MSLRSKWFIAVILLSLAVPAVGDISPSPYRKNQIQFPDDPFRAEGTGDPFGATPGFVKFTILLSEPGTIYFQDCQAYLFHYDFAREVLDPFLGVGAPEYDAVTLHAAGQQAILGAVILPPITDHTPPEYGIQFVRMDPYTPDEIIALFNLVKAAVLGGVNAYYFPAYEQGATAEANREYLASRGVPLGSSSRWTPGNIVYSEGWAAGRLTYVPGNQIQSAFTDGILLPTDILLTDGIPAEVPMVAGFLSLSPSTPNSHLAILTNSYSVPFIYLQVAADAARAQALVGHRVALSVYKGYWTPADLKLMDADGVEEAVWGQLLAAKTPAPLDIAPMVPYGAYAAPTVLLLPEDIQYFGGKAANMGLLRTSIPDNSPVSLAFSFDLWNSFMAQTLPTGRTLREEIHEKLDGYEYPPSNMEQLFSDLDSLRDLFINTDVTTFASEAQTAVLEALQDPQYGFDPDRKIRFRSSTNVEDSGQFTGAGLYDSYSGCLADELDGDETGPSICDPSEKKERGVFRAIRKVFASFYNDNAFLERLRYGVDEDQVGMALLVHHSFPDDEEMANGVATVTRSEYGDITIRMVSQKGAISITNPEGRAVAEEVEIYAYIEQPREGEPNEGEFPGEGEVGSSEGEFQPGGKASLSSVTLYLSIRTSSNLVPMGATVMNWEEDYRDLSTLLLTAAGRFAEVTGKASYVLDFEYKKNSPDGRLIVKQVREVPRPDTSPAVIPFLLNSPEAFCTMQGEYGDIFASHRLKTRARFETKNLRLSEENLQESFYLHTEIEYAADGQVRTYGGPMSGLPGFEHTYSPDTSYDAWSLDFLANPRRYELATEFPALVSPAQNPLFTLRNAGYGGYIPVTVTYDKPEITIDWEGFTTTTTDTAYLCPCHTPQEGDLLQHRHCDGPGGVSIDMRFYWPPNPSGPTAGYTAPLVRWLETRIEGYTSEPIVLTDYYSCTYQAGHHNFWEGFLFEPALEPDIPQATLEELREANIRLIYCTKFLEKCEIITFGFDDGEPEGEQGPLCQRLADSPRDSEIDNFGDDLFITKH